MKSTKRSWNKYKIGSLSSQNLLSVTHPETLTQKRSFDENLDYKTEIPQTNAPSIVSSTVPSQISLWTWTSSVWPIRMVWRVA